jgi:hypothetical protein
MPDEKETSGINPDADKAKVIASDPPLAESEAICSLWIDCFVAQMGSSQ